MKILTLKKNNITDFAKERNNLLKKSNSDWNLFLDSDEVLINSVNQLFNNSITAYYLTRKNYFLNQCVGQEKIIRLVKKRSGKWMRKVHEVFVPNGKTGYLPNIINHNTANNLKDYLNKINNYSNLHADSNRIEKKKSNLFKIIFYPIGKFLLTLLKSKNVVFSIMQSLHSFLSWSKLYFLQH